jgi:RNA polymerase sigma-70 factor, ECF subfamily
MARTAPTADDQGAALMALYDEALPDVYGYLLRRCGSVATAEDLTSETFIAAVDAVRRDRVPSMSVAWLIAVARNKLVDHWRRLAREDRLLDAIEGEAHADDDVWDVVLDVEAAHETLARLGHQHRAALTLRYLDGLAVRDVAMALGRTVGATEVLLVRARRAFRDLHPGDDGDDGEEA